MLKLPKLSKKSPIVNFILHLFVLFIGISGLYYSLFLYPIQQSMQSVNKIKATVEGQKELLIKNRMNVISYATLDTNNPSFADEKAKLLTEMKAANSETLKTLATYKTPQINGLKATKQLLNEELTLIPTMVDKSNTTLNTQNSMINLLTDIMQILNNIYIYDPLDDIGTLDAVNDKDQILERVAIAQKGLTTITNKLDEKNLNLSEVNDLKLNIAEIKAVLTKITLNIEGSDVKSFNSVRQELITKFPTTKEKAFAVEKAIITSPQSIALLTDSTDLINNYDLIINKLTEEQTRLGELKPF
jgi:hypothetical protein